MKTDVLVVGSGIAGLSFAIKVATAKPGNSVLLLTKSNNELCNTAQAQGGIAVVLDRVRDSFEQHIEDTLKAGKYLNDPEIVKMVVSQAPDRLKELIDWGTSFDCNDLGELELGLEGGHSQKRIVHHQDLTGKEMETKLLQKAATLPNITLYDYFFVTDLLINQESKKCIGVKVLEEGKKQEKRIHSRVTFLATGGSGRIFKNTTNPSVATADGVAMAYRAGAEINHMNFIQFHPTALYTKNKHALSLISEAVRGFGAHVVDHEGNRFLFKYTPEGELATRNIVSEAIIKEMKASGKDSVFIDCRHLDPEEFERHFPTIVANCSSLGLNFRTDLIPVVPAAHYQCGGIQVDKFAATSIKHLYASGECAHTGLHGANRLASNSLLEALVYSHQAAGRVVKEIESIKLEYLPQEEVKTSEPQDIDIELLDGMREDLNNIMDYDLLYSSSKKEKEKALLLLHSMEVKLKSLPNGGKIGYFELQNMLQSARLILEHAIQFEALTKTENKVVISEGKEQSESTY